MRLPNATSWAKSFSRSDRFSPTPWLSSGSERNTVIGRCHAAPRTCVRAHHKVMGYEPLFERVGFGGVFRTDLLNAIADLTNHQHAQIQARVFDFFVPSCDVRIASSTLSDFGNNIGVDEIIHSSTFRPKSRARPRSIPPSGAAARRAFSPCV